jgi:adenylyltransferase/sulfurtransferase
MAMAILPGRTPCLRCLFEQQPPPGTSPTCDTVGVFGPVISITAGYQASEALKIMLGRADLAGGGEGDTSGGGLLQFDLWTNERRRLDVGGPRVDCPCCGERRFPFLSGELAGRATVMCGRDTVQLLPSVIEGGPRPNLLVELAGRLSKHGTFSANPFLVRGTLDNERNERGEPYEITVFADGRMLIRGTNRPEVAKSLCAKYIGS